MSTSILGRILGIAIAAGVSDPAQAAPPALVPIDPFCQPKARAECVMRSVDVDPGIDLPEPDVHRLRTLEVQNLEGRLVCSLEAAVQDQPLGCIDMNELTAITPNIDIPGER